MPTRHLPLKGVRVDGAPVEFLATDTPERLYRSLLEGERISKTNPFDCVIFALLMAEVDIHDYVGRGDIQFTVTEHCDLNGQNMTDGDIIDLGAYRGGDDEETYMHTISSAPQEDIPSYLHKLGKDGPVCLSTLESAQRIYNAPIAKQISTFCLEATGVNALNWCKRSDNN